MSFFKKVLVNQLKSQLFKNYERQWENELKTLFISEASQIFKATLKALGSFLIMLYSLILLIEVGTLYFYENNLVVAQMIQFFILMLISSLLLYSSVRFFIELKKKIYMEKSPRAYLGGKLLMPLTRELKNEHTKMLKEYF